MESIRTAEDVLNEKGPEILSVSPDTTIYDALKVMTANKVGAILVKDGEEYVGIWTERDLMHDILEEGFDPKTARIGDYMTTNLISAQHDESILSLADKFLGLRIRHLLIERDGKYIGLLSVGDVIRAGLQERTEQFKELDQIVHLQYYDEWRWKKKKK